MRSPTKCFARCPSAVARRPPGRPARRQRERALVAKGPQPGEELAAKEPPERPNREQEVGPRVLPPIRRRGAAAEAEVFLALSGALFASGRRDEAREVVARGAARLEYLAGRIADADWRARFLVEVPLNRRLIELDGASE